MKNITEVNTEISTIELMQNFTLRIASGENISTEDYADFQALISGQKKSSISEKHIKLQDVANTIGTKLLQQFRKKEVVNLTDKSKKETIKIVFEIDVHTKQVKTSLSVKAPKFEKAKAQAKSEKAKVQQKTINISSK